MREERLLILKMLEEGKITADEAAQLLEALGGEPGHAGPAGRAWAGLGHAFCWRVEDMAGRLARSFGGETYSLEEAVEGCFDAGADRPGLRFITANGQIRVVPGDGSGYQVTVRKEVRAASRAEAEELAAAAVRVSQTGRGLFVDAGRSGRRLHGLAGIQVTIDARLPREAVYGGTFLAANGEVLVEGLRFDNLRAATANGRVQLEGIEADRAGCRAANGSIRVAATVGHLKAAAVNGSLEVRPVPGRPGAEVELSTVNGPIRIGLPAGVPCDVAASARAGRIHVEGPGLETVEEEMGLVGCKLRARSRGDDGPGLAIRATTISGSIRIAPEA